jgi:hypothetical protein
MSQAAGNPYAAELAAAKKAVTLAARLCQAVQKDILQSGVQSKADQSPVTVADYGTICSSLQLLPRFLPLMFATELLTCVLIRIWNS